ncbi:MAG: protein-disulfide reductase DsbD family protein [Muribaculaceae bacterium]
MIRRFFALLTIAVCAVALHAEILTPVKWTSEVTMTDDSHGVMTFTATIDDGWHLYSTNLPKGGPQPLTITIDTADGVALNGELTPSKAPHEQVDNVFHMKLGWWTGGVTLTQAFTVTKPDYSLEGYLTYMLCNDVTCQSPAKEYFSFKGAAKAATQPVAVDSATPSIPMTELKPAEKVNVDELWAPVDADAAAQGDSSRGASTSHSFWYIFIGGFLGGLLALLTPCVWPMIPLTVSFFLKKNTSRASSIRDAMLYGGSIIVIYLLLGLLITALFGASSLNALSTNAIFNIIFFAMLVVFAISFFGAFDIKLPDSWANKMDSKAEATTGLLSIFFMAFTLTLVSFSCTGPIIGTLLVEAAGMGDFTGPAIGMGGFALALAIPFTLFAIFPSWLKEMPKSGGWLNSVKVVLGFIELALSLKFLSVADLAYGWGILDRETFVALWVVIFALLGMYLLGKIRFSHDSELKGGIGVFRFFLALISLSFSVYLLPGLWGAPLKSVSAFVPPLYTQDFNLYGGGFSEYDDYDEGMRQGAAQDKPVLVDFSGYGCVNCRKMEAAVMDNSRVRKVIEDNYVMIKLMVDDKKALPEPIYVDENGKKVKLTTYGDRWSYLQRYKFGANSQPYYVVLNARGELISGPYYYDENIDSFIGFLNKGIEKY